MTLSIPRRGIIRPNAIPQVNWDHPVAAGLTLLFTFEGNYGPLVQKRGVVSKTLNGGADFRPGSHNFGLTGNSSSSSLGSQSGNTFKLNQQAGTILAHVCASWGPADAVSNRYIHLIGSGTFPTGPTFDFLKTSGAGSWFFGWYSGADTRASALAAGTFNAGEPFVIGGTWAPSGTNLWCRGKKIGTNATAPSTGDTTTGGIFGLGNFISTSTSFFGTPGKDAMYMWACWDRPLTDGELVQVSQDPYCFLSYPDDDLLQMIKGTFVPPTFNAGSFNRNYPVPNFRSYPVETSRSFPRY